MSEKEQTKTKREIAQEAADCLRQIGFACSNVCRGMDEITDKDAEIVILNAQIATAFTMHRIGELEALLGDGSDDQTANQ